MEESINKINQSIYDKILWNVQYTKYEHQCCGSALRVLRNSNPVSAEHPLSRRGHNAILLHTRGRPSRQFAAITPIVIKAVVVLGYGVHSLQSDI